MHQTRRQIRYQVSADLVEPQEGSIETIYAAFDPEDGGELLRALATVKAAVKARQIELGEG